MQKTPMLRTLQLGTALQEYRLSVLQNSKTIQKSPETKIKALYNSHMWDNPVSISILHIPHYQ